MVIYLDITQVEPDVRSWRHLPILVAPLCETLDDVCLISHKSQKTHDFLSTTPDTPEHVALFCLLQDKHEFIDTIDFVFDALDERPKSISDVINKSIGYPVGSDTDIILQLLDATTNVLRVWCRSEVELECDFISSRIDPT